MTNPEQKATPRPWEIKIFNKSNGYIRALIHHPNIAGTFITNDDIAHILEKSIGTDEAIANAQLICTAVNSHDDLIAQGMAKDSCIRVLRDTEAELIETLQDVKRYLQSVEKYLPETQDRDEVVENIMEALEKVEGMK